MQAVIACVSMLIIIIIIILIFKSGFSTGAAKAAVGQSINNKTERYFMTEI